MPKEKNICKDLSFVDCELAILRMAVDKAEEKWANVLRIQKKFKK